MKKTNAVEMIKYVKTPIFITDKIRFKRSKRLCTYHSVVEVWRHEQAMNFIMLAASSGR